MGQAIDETAKPKQDETAKPEQDKPEQQTTPVEEVRNLVKAWVKAWSRHRIEQFLALYSPSFRPSGHWTKQQWETSYKNFLGASSTIRVTLTDMAVELESDNQAKAFVYLMFK